MFKVKEVSLVDRIRTIQRAERANKQCANCTEMGPVYICTDFHTFICTECSGLHRELSHKVKSISMSNWTRDEVDALEKSGCNTKDHELYLATFDGKAFPEPTSSNRSRLREYIRAKYIERRWVNTGKTAVRIKDVPEMIGDTPKKGRKEKKEKKHHHHHDDEDLFSQGSSEKQSSKPVARAPLIAASSLLSPEEEIQAHFSRGMESLEKLYKANQQQAQLLASTVMEGLRQQFLTTRNPTPVETSVIPTALTNTPSSNPFDFLPPPAAVVQSQTMLSVPLPNFSQIPAAPSVIQPPSSSVGTANSNPFDFFQ